MKNFFLYLLLILAMSNCGHQHRYKKRHKHSVFVKKYKVVNPNGSATETVDDDFLYWYIISSSNQNYPNDYYVYGCNRPVTSFSNVPWSRTFTIPASVSKELKEHPEEEFEEQEVEVSEFSEVMQQEIELNAEYFENMSVDETSSMSANTREEDEDDNESENDSESESESSDDSSDSSSDSGDGDSGGGDGGGGE